MSVHLDWFKRYREHRPTQFDYNIDIDDADTKRSEWFLMPVSRTRDSAALAESNFDCFIKGLGGESETVEVHRFGHWGPGWYEIIIVSPEDEKALQKAYDMHRALMDYPILNKTDLSEREQADFVQSWNAWICGDFRDALASYYRLGDAAKDRLDLIDKDVLRELWTEVADVPYTSSDEGTNVRFERADLRRIGRPRLTQLLRHAKP